MNIHSSWQFVKLVYNYQLYLQQSSFMSMIMFSEKLSKRFPLSLCVPNEACWGGEVLSRLMFADCVEIAGEWGSLIQLYTSHQSGFHFYLNCCFRAEIFWQGYNVFYSGVTRKHEIMIPPGFMSASQQYAVQRVEEWKMFSYRIIHNDHPLCQEVYNILYNCTFSTI